MTVPIIKLYDANDIDEITNANPDNVGTVTAGDNSTDRELHIWNNKGGSTDVSTAENLRITTVTLNFEEGGGEPSGGREIVEEQMMSVKSLTNNEEVFTSVGGAISHLLGDIRGNLLEAPANLSGAPASEDGGRVRPGDYYGKVVAEDATGLSDASNESPVVNVLAMLEESDEDSDSETLDNTTNTRLAYKFTSNGTYINGAAVKMSIGGNLQGSVRIETDNAGSPSGTLVDGNAEKTNVVFLDDELTYLFFDETAEVDDSTVYWLVVTISSGTGSLRGNVEEPIEQVKYYDGEWKTSGTICNLTCLVMADNAIYWSWDSVPDAVQYKVYRTITTGDYPDNSMVADYVGENEVYDLIDDPATGKPPVSATASREHFHSYERRLSIPTHATSGVIEFFQELRYSYI